MLPSDIMTSIRKSNVSPFLLWHLFSGTYGVIVLHLMWLMLEQHQMGYFALFWNDQWSASAIMKYWRQLWSGCKDRRLSLESWIANPWSIVRYYKKVCAKYLWMNLYCMRLCKRDFFHHSNCRHFCRDCEKTDRSIYPFPVNQASLMSVGLLDSGSGCNRNLLWWWNHRVSCPFSTLKELRAFVVL